LQKVVGWTVKGPDLTMRTRNRSYVWARAANAKGEFKEAWLDTVEGYQLTALVGVRVVEKVLAQRLVGAHTPAGAFGEDLVMEIETTKRFDALPG
jgi:short subunit dehydrogenase-like uncharacterized protein